MEKYNNLQPIFHDIQQNEIIEIKRKELLGNLASNQYAGYNELYN